MNALRAGLMWGLLFCCSLVAAQDEALLAPLPPDEIYGAPTDETVWIGSNSSAEPMHGFRYGGWFGGVGGSFNSVRIDQVLSGSGTTEIYNGPTLVATGTADGPAPPFHDTLTTFAPLAQAGYVRNFHNSNLLWGAKVSYKYLGITSTNQNIDAPQVGSYVEVADPTNITYFTGNAFTLSAQATVNHEIAILPMLGYAYKRGRFYAGGGPVVFGTESNFYGLYSYADIDGVHTDIGGPPVNLHDTAWIWGGAWQIGTTYHLGPCCFIDFCYDFMVTGKNTEIMPTPVTSESNGLTYDTLILYSFEQRVWAQSFNVTFNLTF